MDEGSSYTLIEEDLANALRAGGVVQPLRVKWTTGVFREEKNSRMVNLDIAAKGPAKRFSITNARTVKDLK